MVLCSALILLTVLTACGGDRTIYIKFDTAGGTPLADYRFRTQAGVDVLFQSIRDPEKDGYDFVGWLVHSDYSGPEPELAEIRSRFNGQLVLTRDCKYLKNIKIGKDVTFVAVWNEREYTVVFDAHGGSPVDSQKIKAGQ